MFVDPPPRTIVRLYRGLWRVIPRGGVCGEGAWGRVKRGCKVEGCCKVRLDPDNGPRMVLTLLSVAVVL
jgi:hypothetical protein